MMTAATYITLPNPSAVTAPQARGAASTAPSAGRFKSPSVSLGPNGIAERQRCRYRFSLTGTFALLLLQLTPLLAFAQASPFETGATALQSNLLAIMTPIAIILIVVLGIAAMVNRISWGWAAAAVAGIAIAFGAPQMVAWVRGMFGV